MAKKKRENTNPVEVLQFIKDFIAENAFPPTLREIAAEFGFRSSNGVRWHLGVLERRGLITRVSVIARGIRVVETKRGQNRRAK